MTIKKNNSAILNANDFIIIIIIAFTAHSLVGNIINYVTFTNVLKFYTKNYELFGKAIITFQIVVCALLLFPKTRLAGFITNLVLAGFGIFIITKYANYPHEFGGLLTNSSDTIRLILLGTSSLFSLFGVYCYVHLQIISRKQIDYQLSS